MCPFSHEQIYPTDVLGPLEGDANYRVNSVNVGVSLLSSLVMVRRFSLDCSSVSDDIAKGDLLLGSSKFSLWALKNGHFNFLKN